MTAKNVFNSRTLIPWSMVASALLLVATAAWNGASDRERTHGRVTAVETKVAEHDVLLKEQGSDLRSVRDGVIRLETRFGTLPPASAGLSSRPGG
jgi:hypothetical protein